MKTRAAITYETNQPWDVEKHQWVVEELEIAPLQPEDVLVRIEYSGVCHTDLHLVTGDLPAAVLPMIGGHEGAGIVEEVGSAVTDIKAGDHVVLSIVPSCGKCRYCKMGQSHLCDLAMVILSGRHPDGNFRYKNHAGQDVGQWSMLGTFSEYVVCHKNAVVQIAADMPKAQASIVGCAVTTGFGAAVQRANVRAGDIVVVWGCGGVGLSAVQGAALQGAAEVIAVDLKDAKLSKAMELGATMTLNPSRDRSPNPNRDETAEVILRHTNWDGADSAILAVDYVTPDLIGAAFATIRKGGTLVIVGVTHPKHQSINVSGLDITFGEKTITGCVYGAGAPQIVIPRNLNLYQKGHLKLDEMITSYYSLEQVNDAFEDLLNGNNIKGIIRF